MAGAAAFLLLCWCHVVLHPQMKGGAAVGAAEGQEGESSSDEESEESGDDEE